MSVSERLGKKNWKLAQVVKESHEKKHAHISLASYRSSGKTRVSRTSEKQRSTMAAYARIHIVRIHTEIRMHGSENLSLSSLILSLSLSLWLLLLEGSPLADEFFSRLSRFERLRSRKEYQGADLPRLLLFNWKAIRKLGLWYKGERKKAETSLPIRDNVCEWWWVRKKAQTGWRVNKNLWNSWPELIIPK